MSDLERKLLLDAFDSNWIAPLGPYVDTFERETAERIGVAHALATSSGTAALHLALLSLGVRPGQEVLVSTLTFAATANAVTYVGARPVFVDCEIASWNIDPALVADELDRRAAVNCLPAALIAVDLYGQCADYDRLVGICDRYGVPLIEDAAEALGATHGRRAAGSLGTLGVLSFNGNKIITCGGGGMLLSNDGSLVARARHFATQSRQPVAHYEHAEIGYNYRLSNLLAAVGVGQLRTLAAKVARRRAINRRYRARLETVPGVDFMPIATWGEPTHWLTCITIDPHAFGATRDDLVRKFSAHDIEVRPTWKPMHLQPAFAAARSVGGDVSRRVFEVGLCLPSGSSMRDEDVDRVAAIILEQAHSR